MGSLTGIIILTAALKPLITTPFRPASLLPLYTDAFCSSAAAKGKQPEASRSSQDDSVLWVGDGVGSLCWISRGGLFFLCGVGREGASAVLLSASRPARAQAPWSAAGLIRPSVLRASYPPSP